MQWHFKEYMTSPFVKTTVGMTEFSTPACKQIKQTVFQISGQQRFLVFSCKIKKIKNE